MLDTKSKNNNKWLGNLLCVLLILVMAAGTLFCYPGIRQAAMKRMDDYRATAGITDGQKDTDDLVYTDEYGEWNYISYINVYTLSTIQPASAGSIDELIARFVTA